jgi:ABC-type oligopeptide transport system ATPase subunit
MENKNNLLEVRNLKQYFNIPVGLLKSKPLKAVDDISFSIRKGETLGLVGESGCGKTTVGRSILQLYKPTSGEIIFNGKKIESKESIKYLRQNAQMVNTDNIKNIIFKSPTMDNPLGSEDISIQKASLEQISILNEMFKLNSVGGYEN